MRGTIGDVGAALGVEAGEPADLYAEHADFGPDEELAVDQVAATLLLDWFARGDQALRQFAPAEDPILWPEHFDLGIATDEVNYGVSPGDAGHPCPMPTWVPGRLARESSGTRRSAPSGLRRNCPTRCSSRFLRRGPRRRGGVNCGARPAGGRALGGPSARGVQRRCGE